MTRGALLGLICAVACGDAPTPSDPPVAKAATTPTDAPFVLDGRWRATLASPGGVLPFGLEFARGTAVALNGPERVPFSSVDANGREVQLRIDVYDSMIRATASDDGTTMSGEWTKTTPDGPSTMTFDARRGAHPRFDAAIASPPHDVPDTIDGDWSITFTEDDGNTFVGQGVFARQGTQQGGTILTDTGDYRYLAGRYQSGTLELSCFDGGHAFLFRATVGADAKLHGDFWSRGQYHARWVGTRLPDGDAGPLADPYGVVGLSAAAKDGRFRFAFPDLDGNTVSDTDARFVGKVVLIDIFGTWCPNCNDYAPLLATWHKRYADRGLEIVGLAFEMTGDAARDRAYVAKYGRKHGLAFPLLLAGTSDKADAAALLPALTKVASYPTTVFVGRDGKVHKIHSGFAGPATGEHHTRMVAQMEREIEALLKAEAER